MKRVNELLKMLNGANQEEMNALYKAMMAYSVGLDEVNEKTNEVLNEVLEDEYFENDNVRSFINDELFDYLDERIEDIH
jgi:uncharacterized lipoprotein YajG